MLGGKLGKFISDTRFWIGFLTAFLLNLLDNFFGGIEDWKTTMFFGSIAILMIGYNFMLEKDEK